MTDEDLFRALATRYALPEWVLVPQVRDATGWAGDRTADAVAMNCYPSKGLEVHGFEFKVSRSDWLRELRDGSKAEAVAKNCDRWWIVAPPDVVSKADLPVTWGLLVVRDGELRTYAAAPPLPTEGRDLRRPFVASFLRGCLTRAMAPTDAALAAAREAGAEAQKKAAADLEQSKEARASRELEQLRTAVRGFETASGVRIDPWDGASVGAEFAAFMALRGNYRGLESLAKSARDLREVADTIDKLRADAKEAVR